MTTTIPAIETSYAGYRFRSRTEAKWAVFFDQAGLKWEYEPAGYVVDGTPYLPDFLITLHSGRKFWLEIKGQYPTAEEKAKAAALATGTGLLTFVYFGDITQPGPGLSRITTWNEYMKEAGVQWTWNDRHGWILNGSIAYEWQIGLFPTAIRFDPGSSREPRSAFWWWTDCPVCGHVCLKYEGQVGWCPSIPDNGADCAELPPEVVSPRFGHESERLRNAYALARAARFEHGQTPQRPPGAGC